MNKKQRKSSRKRMQSRMNLRGRAQMAKDQPAQPAAPEFSSFKRLLTKISGMGA